jgi:hypothetical protein
MNQRIIRTLAIICCFISLTSCKTKPEPEGYRVVGYDAATQQWTIIRTGNFDGKFLTKRLIVVCEFYRWGSHEMVKGPDACHLVVGRLIVPNPLPSADKRSEFLDVFEMPSETLAITEGDGAGLLVATFLV